MKVARTRLHEWMWSVPAIRLAAALGVSSKTLDRLCKKHAIPTPPRGHWRKLERRYSVTPIALPNPEDAHLIELPGEDTRLEQMESWVRAAFASGPLQSSAPLVTSAPGEQRPPPAPEPRLLSDAVPEDDQLLLVRASAEDLLRLGSTYRAHRDALAAIEEVQAAAHALEDDRLRGLISFWAQRSRQALTPFDPIAATLRTGQRLLLQQRRPLWWSDIWDSEPADSPFQD